MKPDKARKISICLSDGNKLTVEQNEDPEYKNEVFVGIVNREGNWIQTLAVIRNRFEYGNDGCPKWQEGEFQVEVYSNPEVDDWMNSFEIPLRSDD